MQRVNGLVGFSTVPNANTVEFLGSLKTGGDLWRSPRYNGHIQVLLSCDVAAVIICNE